MAPPPSRGPPGVALLAAPQIEALRARERVGAKVCEARLLELVGRGRRQLVDEGAVAGPLEEGEPLEAPVLDRARAVAGARRAGARHDASHDLLVAHPVGGSDDRDLADRRVARPPPPPPH